MARPILPHSYGPRDPGPGGPLLPGMKRTRSGRIKPRGVIWRARKVLVGVAVTGVLGTSAVAANYWSNVALPELSSPPEASFLCAADVETGCDANSAFAEVGAEAGVNVRYEQIPEVLVQALVAAEDKDFFRHQGIDPAGIGRALWHDVRNDGLGRQGGSTLTQQLIKNVSDNDAPTLERKVDEAIQAMKLEREHSKQEIITSYFNTIYYGRNAQGLDAAVRAYFGPNTRVEDVDLAKAAYLAAIIREPEFVDANRQPDDPLRDKQRTYATRRRADVLDAMVREHYITTAERDQVAVMGWDYVVPRGDGPKGAIRNYAEIGARQWYDFVQRWITNPDNTPITEQQLKSDGLRVYTAMDPALQRQAYDAVTGTLANAGPEPHVGMASIDDRGYLRAMVGSRDPRSLGQNLAVDAYRQPGSSFKPVVLAQYLSQSGRSLLDEYENPREKPVGNELIRSVEGDDRINPANLIEATIISSNTVFAQAQFDTKNADTIHLAETLGLDRPEDGNFKPLDDARRSAFLGIGNPVHASPLEMAEVYSVFANRGEKIGPFPVVKITTARGRPLWEAPTERARVVPQEIADQINYVLRQVVENKDGTGYREARIPGQVVAGKTGTVAVDDPTTKRASVNTDAWFVGYTCKLTAAVWMGNEQTTDIGTVEGVNPVNGGTLPARIFQRYMAAAMQNRQSCPFELPPAVRSAMTSTTAPPSTLDQPNTTNRRGRPGAGDFPFPPSSRRFPGFPFTSTTEPDGETTTTSTRRNPRSTTTTTTTDFPGLPRQGLVGN